MLITTPLAPPLGGATTSLLPLLGGVFCTLQLQLQVHGGLDWQFKKCAFSRSKSHRGVRSKWQYGAVLGNNVSTGSARPNSSFSMIAALFTACMMVFRTCTSLVGAFAELRITILFWRGSVKTTSKSAARVVLNSLTSFGFRTPPPTTRSRVPPSPASRRALYSRAGESNHP